MKAYVMCSVAALAMAACAPVKADLASAPAATPLQPLAVPPEATAHADAWPAAHSPAAITDPATEAKITAIIAKMTLRQKIGQIIQGDITSVKPADLAEYPLGSILAGGNSGPYGNERSSAADWDRLVREYRAASMAPRSEGVAVPILFGVDAVHGHSNIPGATLFPHNVGLGATHDPELLYRIGAVTGAEIAGSGIEWTFAPTLAVPQDERWGRAYEGYSSDPKIVAEYSSQMVLGLQGKLVAGQPLANDKAAATAKHFLADGGTDKGHDQGDAKISEADLVRIHAAGYAPAIDAGVLTVMASFSSWNGVKNTANYSLLTTALKQKMGFEGLLVSDWNAHGQIPGCETSDCPYPLLAGLDLYMAPDSWKPLFESLLRRAEAGEIPMARLDDAIRRILRVKFKLGLMDGDPSRRGDFSAIGSPAHLAVAREAVAKSLVLLKNEGSVLPVRPGAKVLVTGPGADSMAMQSGGWTISWQGADVTHADFPNGQTVWEGIDAAVKDAGGTATLSADGSYTTKPDVAIVVFGETPYAEFQGDRTNLDFDGPGLDQIKALKAKGIPVVAVFLSGRPMFTGREMAAADAFVAAWLPGSQGAGIADVLVAGTDGKSKRDFTGTLSFAWPAGCEPGAPELFPLGFGGSYAAKPVVPALVTTCSLSGVQSGDGTAIFDRGLKTGFWSFAGDTGLVNLTGTSPNFRATAFDIAAQEDARRLIWTGPAFMQLRWDLRGFGEEAALKMHFKVDHAPTAPLRLKALGPNATGPVDMTSTFKLAEGKGMREMEVPLACLAKGDISGLELASDGEFVFELDSIRIVPQATQMDCTGPF